MMNQVPENVQLCHTQVYYYTAIRMRVERIKWQQTHIHNAATAAAAAAAAASVQTSVYDCNAKVLVAVAAGVRCSWNNNFYRYEIARRLFIDSKNINKVFEAMSKRDAHADN